MTRINDFHLFAGGYVIVTLMGISRRLRCRASTGGTRKRRGGRHRSDEAFLSFSDRDGCDSIIAVTTSESLPTDLAAAHAMILAERLQAEAVAASAKAEAANAKAAEALISYLKLEIEKMRRQIYGSRSERKARLLEQMELQLEELEATQPTTNWRLRGPQLRRRPSSPSSEADAYR
ncbi:hypothetical protein ACVJGD_004207 [Bradyrhizobium sp. USDA 10063]